MKLGLLKTVDLSRFNEEGHWFTSYPSMGHWGPMDEETYRKDLETLGTRPVHLYLHIPFCKKLCSYCICNVVISSDTEKMQTFVDHLCKEIDLLKPYKPNVREIHFGGGTPSHLTRRQFAQLCEKLGELCDFSQLDEVAMEIDPRTVKNDDLLFYALAGVTRISFGIQDYDERVQKAINREQPAKLVSSLLEDRHYFRGVNFDLLYGLPHQSHKTISETLRIVKEQSPDRITLLKYCHAPDVRRHMRLINVTDLPPEKDLPHMFLNITEELTETGYNWIGIDHFAKPTDSLSTAKELGRTFNGFTPGRTRDMVGLGPTATGAFGATYAQSLYELPQYYKAIDEGKLPVFRGLKLTSDDVVRREVIFSLLTKQEVDLNRYGSYFEKERRSLCALPEYCHVREGVVRVNTLGRVMLRTLCRVFDNREKGKYRIAQLSMTTRAA